MNEAAYREVEQRLWASVGRQPEEHFVDLPRLGARVRIQVLGEGPATLFVHGGPNSGSTWAPMLEHVDGVRCLLLDRPGTGLSDDYSWQPGDAVDFAKVLVPDVLDALQLERAHVVASSFGGYCALWSAAEAPERFERMVQMACPALLPGQQPPPFMRWVMLPGVRKLIAALPPNKGANESIMRQIGHGASLDAGRLPEAHADWYAALHRYTNTMRNDFDLIYSVKGSDGFDPTVSLGEETLAAVPTPTHFIWGADDGFGGEAVAQWAVEVMPNATLDMMADAGHLPWLDDPAYVADETTRFLLET